MEKVSHKNRKASFEFTLINSYSAGIVLTGSEVKSIRAGHVNFTDSFCIIDNDEIFIKNLHIEEYKNSGYVTHDPNRLKKLLLKKQEIYKLKKEVTQRGITIIPIELFNDERNKFKVRISTGKGKKLYDKRQSIKEREQKRMVSNLSR